MTSKKLNIILIVFLVLFAVIFGVTAALKQQELDRLDREHDKAVQDAMNQANQDIYNNNSTTEKNNNSNKASLPFNTNGKLTANEFYNICLN